MTGPTTRMPLDGMRILDLSTMIAAPMASSLLADFGADVVKIELPSGTGDGLRDLPPHKDGAPLWWKVTNRNKRGMTLDIRKDEGKVLFRALLAQFDVLVENFRPGTLGRYGFPYETLKKINPDLVVLRVSGYGQTGPMAPRPGFARIAEAFSGFTSLCGNPEDAPLHIGYPVADAVAGMFGAIGILVACYRQKTDPDANGEEIDVSLIESMMRMLEFSVIEYDQLGVARQRSGNRSQYAGPSNVYKTRDGRWFSMSASAQSVFVRLAQAIGRPDLLQDPNFATNAARVRNADALDDIVGGWIGERSLDEIMAVLEEHGVSGGPVNDARDVYESDHLRAREAIVDVPDGELGSVAMQGVIPVMTEAPGRVRSTGPMHGEHSDEVLSSLLGLDAGQIDDLRRKQVI